MKANINYLWHMGSDDKQPHKFSPRTCSLRGTLKTWRLSKHTAKRVKEQRFSRTLAAIFKKLKRSMEIDLDLSYLILES